MEKSVAREGAKREQAARSAARLQRTRGHVAGFASVAGRGVFGRTLDVLIAARAEVEKGWCKNVAVDHRGNVCAVGAVDVAAGMDRRTRAFVTFRESGGALAALTDAMSTGHRSLPLFNDDPQTTKADVLALFDRAIAAEAVKVPDPAHTYTVAA